MNRETFRGVQGRSTQEGRKHGGQYVPEQYTHRKKIQVNKRSESRKSRPQ